MCVSYKFQVCVCVYLCVCVCVCLNVCMCECMRQYRANGFAVFRSCSHHGKRKLVVWYGTGVYGSNTLFSVPFC